MTNMLFYLTGAYPERHSGWWCCHGNSSRVHDHSLWCSNRGILLWHHLHLWLPVCHSESSVVHNLTFNLRELLKHVLWLSSLQMESYWKKRGKTHKESMKEAALKGEAQWFQLSIVLQENNRIIKSDDSFKWQLSMASVHWTHARWWQAPQKLLKVLMTLCQSLFSHRYVLVLQ